MKRLRAIMILAVCLLVLLSYSASSWQPVESAPPPPKYNVLFIIADDFRPDLGAYGNQIIQTPNIDALAARGTRFDHAYAQFPLCNPSRASLLNGRYPTQTGIMDNNSYFRAKHPEYVTLPQYFQKNGYASLRSGKIFHGGIDDPPSWTEGGEPPDPTILNRPPSRIALGAAPSDQPEVPQQGRAPNTSESGSDRIIVLNDNGESHGDYKVATRAIQYLEQYKDKEQPFFLAVGFVKPHSPPTAPKKFFDLYDVDKIPLPVDFAPRPSAPAGFPEISISKRNADLFIGRDASPAQAREMIRAYYASTSFMDAQVGRVIEALDRLNLRERTIIVFWGDHGYHLGEKGKWSKAYSLFDIALRVPLIIDLPKGKAQVSQRTVQLLDMYPTLAELCGLPAPADIAGHSFASLLKKPNAAWSHPAFSVVMFQGKLGRSVRTERWHYVEWDGGRAGAMLCDTVSDPHELKNLASDPNYAKTVREMKNLLTQLPDK